MPTVYEHRSQALDALMREIRDHEDLAAAHARWTARTTARGHHGRAALHANLYLERLTDIRDLEATLTDILTITT